MQGAHDLSQPYGLRMTVRKAFVRPSPASVGAMADVVDPDDLVGASEIAERLHLASTSVIHDWRRRHPDFPQPIRELSMGLLWRWPDVENWARITNRMHDR